MITAYVTRPFVELIDSATRRRLHGTRSSGFVRAFREMYRGDDLSFADLLIPALTRVFSFSLPFDAYPSRKATVMHDFIVR